MADGYNCWFFPPSKSKQILDGCCFCLLFLAFSPKAILDTVTDLAGGRLNRKKNNNNT